MKKQGFQRSISTPALIWAIMPVVGIGVAVFLFHAPFSIADETSTQVAQNDTETAELMRQIEDKKSAISDLENQIADFKANIESRKRDQLTLKNQIGILDAEIGQAELQIQKTKEEIDAVTLDIANTTLGIAELEVKIESEKEVLSDLIREMYRYDQRSTLEVMLGYTQFSEFFSEANYLDSIQKSIVDLVGDIRNKKDALTVQREQLERKKSELDDLALQLESDSNNLKGQRDAKDELLSVTAQDESKFQQLLASAKQEQDQANSDIISLEAKARAKLSGSPARSVQPIGPGGLSWPISARIITAYFHDPTYIYRKYFEHPAIDIATPQGTPVKAAADGIVAIAKNLDWVKNDQGKILYPAYNYVLVVHDGGLSTVYGHLSVVSVSEGDYVVRGSTIGKSGAIPGTAGAGRLTTGPHLHFEVRQNGIPVNPLDYLPM